MKHKPIEKPKLIGCASCSSVKVVLPKNAVCAVGFGQVNLVVDHELIWSGDDENLTMESLVAYYSERIKSGECATIEFCGPLHDETYEYNKEDGNWYLIKQGMGFA